MTQHNRRRDDNLAGYGVGDAYRTTTGRDPVYVDDSTPTPASNAWSLRLAALVAYVGTVILVAASAGIDTGVVVAIGTGIALLLALLATLVDREAGQ